MLGNAAQYFLIVCSVKFLFKVMVSIHGPNRGGNLKGPTGIETSVTLLFKTTRLAR